MKRNLLTLLIVIAMVLSIGSSAVPLNTSSLDARAARFPTERVVARIYYNGQEDLNNLAVRYDILEVKTEVGVAQVLLTPLEYAELQQAGYRLEIDETKTQLLNNPREALPGQGTDSIPGYPCYRTVEETYIDLESLASNNPGMTELLDIGDSWEKATVGGLDGYDILALRVTNEDPQFGAIDDKPTFFLMAEIHAREYVTAEAAMRFSELLLGNYGSEPDITWLLDYFRVYIVTLTNPDGRKHAESGDWWRKNTDSDDGCSDPGGWGTDLNRNHSFKWGCCGGSSGYACDEVYRGPTAASEPETQAIQDFVLTLFADQRGPGDNNPAPADTTGVFISLHSYSQLVLWPWGWTTTAAPNHTQLQTLGRHMAYFNSYTPQQSNQLYTTDGTSDDWSYGELGIASYTYEMGTEFFQDCGAFENTIYPNNRDALLYAFKTARQPYMDPAGPDSITLTATPAAVEPGEMVLLSATSNDTRFMGGEPVQNIAEARFSIDAPSWIAGTTSFPMTAGDGSFNSSQEGIEAIIDTTGFTAGRHTIFVESKDANNNWGVASATFLYIVEPGVSPIIEGHVREAGTLLPIDASISAGLFNATSDPATGYYSMTVISSTYNMVVEADGYAPAYATVLAEDYQSIQQDFLLYPVCNVFTDDVESGNLGWTPQNPWAITIEASHSPNYSWTDSPGDPYFNYQDVSLTSQVLDLSDTTGVTLDFWHTYDTEAGWDYAYVEINTGNGWEVVSTYDGYQNWTEVKLLLPELDGEANARIRFHFTSDTWQVEDGWHIDDISLTAGGAFCMPDVAPVTEFSSNSPVLLGQPVQLNNLTTGSEPMAYEWDFGDGLGTSTETNPSYIFSATGTYTVTLTATNEMSTDSVSHEVTVDAVLLKFFLPFTAK